MSKATKSKPEVPEGVGVDSEIVRWSLAGNTISRAAPNLAALGSGFLPTMVRPSAGAFASCFANPNCHLVS